MLKEKADGEAPGLGQWRALLFLSFFSYLAFFLFVFKHPQVQHLYLIKCKKYHFTLKSTLICPGANSHKHTLNLPANPTQKFSREGTGGQGLVLRLSTSDERNLKKKEDRSHDGPGDEPQHMWAEHVLVFWMAHSHSKPQSPPMLAPPRPGHPL